MIGGTTLVGCWIDILEAYVIFLKEHTSVAQSYIIILSGKGKMGVGREGSPYPLVACREAKNLSVNMI